MINWDITEFQLAYTPNAFREERLAWRSVIYLNLVRSVRRIIEAISPVDSPNTSTGSDPTDDEGPSHIQRLKHDSSESYAPRPSLVQGSSSTLALFSSPHYAELITRLAPLLSLEEQLFNQLAAGEDDEATRLAWPAAHDAHRTTQDQLPAPSSRKNEVSVNTRNNWKKALNKLALGSKSGVYRLIKSIVWLSV